MGLIVLLGVALWIAGFLDAFTVDVDRIRVAPRAIWLFVILVLPVFGAIAWFIFGRPRSDQIEGAPGHRRGLGSFRGFGPADGESRDGDNFGSRSQHPSASGRGDDPADGWQLGGTGGRRRGPVAPDDDPEFLRSLGRPKPPQPDDPA